MEARCKAYSVSLTTLWSRVEVRHDFDVLLRELMGGRPFIYNLATQARELRAQNEDRDEDFQICIHQILGSSRSSTIPSTETDGGLCVVLLYFNTLN